VNPQSFAEVLIERSYLDHVLLVQSAAHLARLASLWVWRSRYTSAPHLPRRIGQWTMPARTTPRRVIAASPRSPPRMLAPAAGVDILHRVLAGHEGQPLVANDTMYVSRPGRTCCTRSISPGEGYPLKWKYRPNVSPNAIGISCCDVINRGRSTSTARSSTTCSMVTLVAVDAATGHELWKTADRQSRRRRDHTHGPLRS